MEKLVGRLRAYWMHHGVTIRAGATQDRIAFFEREHGVEFEPEMRQIYAAVDGMESGEMDPINLIRFWPLSEMVPIENEMPTAAPSYGGYIVFADHSLWAHAYAWKKQKGGLRGASIIIAGGEEPIEIASSFGQFVEWYVSNDRRLFG